jgi:2-polyprenyl-6-methoxyphenol hydroxylase-like FAD-dependent oxidoreductase
MPWLIIAADPSTLTFSMERLPSHAAVLVAGAGPCGLMLACELGRRGVDCLVVDPREAVAAVPQANATQARTMEHFRRLGLAETIRSQGLPPDHPTDIAYVTRFAGHELARLSLPTARQAREQVRRLSGSWSAAELPHRISQRYVEATLLDHVRSLSSVRLFLGWRLQDFHDDGERVTAQVVQVRGARSDGSVPGEAVTVDCRFLVGADGARSFVRNRLGIRHGGTTGVRRDFMGGQMFAVHLRAPGLAQSLPHPRSWMTVAINAERRAFMCALDGDTEFVFHAAVRPDEDASRWDAGQARRIFEQAMGRPQPIEVLSVGTWTAGHSLVAERFGIGNVFIGGDAAHLFTPTGGLGYNTAVEDAVNLGWKLASVLRGIAPATLLATYEIERKPLALRNTAYARRFADSVGNFRATPLLEEDSPAGGAERARAGVYLDAHARLEFNIPGVTFGGRYDDSPLIVNDGTTPPPDDANVYVPTACPGGRPPHCWLDDGRSLYDTFGLEWTLLRLGPDAPEAAPFAAAATMLRIELAVVTLPSPALRALYEAPLALIRPDQMVAWRGGDARDAEAVLSRACGVS